MTSEQLLLTYAQTGDESLFDELVRRYWDKFVSFLGRRGLNCELTEDLIQDTFLQVHLKCHTYRGESKASTWMYTILRNLFSSYYRRMKQKDHGFRKYITRLVPASAKSWLITKNDFDDDNKQTIIRIVDAAESLDPMHRSVVDLVDLRSLTYDDAAAALHVPVGTIRSRRHRAIAIMRRELSR